MSKKEKSIMKLAVAFALTFGMVSSAYAMHIMEGYLPAGYCIAWGALSIPFLTAGFFSIQKKLRDNRRSITVLAMSGAFVFVLSSLKIPSVTGSCSHMTGTGLGAILFGPSAVSILGIIVIDIPGSAAGTRRPYHTGSQYLFYGNCRSFRVFWNIQIMVKH